MPLSIGTLSKRTNVKVVTIRYYEQIGLLCMPERTDGRQRRYTDEDVTRLLFIRQARELGFEVDAIRTFLAFAYEGNVPDAELVRYHLDDVRLRIAALETLRQELSDLGEGTARGPRLVEVLARFAAGNAALPVVDEQA